FSSRRRHTRSTRDWSSDVCSSDLTQLGLAREIFQAAYRVHPMPILDQIGHKIERYATDVEVSLRSGDEVGLIAFLRREVEGLFRSEERRVGEECRSRWGPREL